MEKSIELMFKKVNDFKGNHGDAVIVIDEEGKIGYGSWEKEGDGNGFVLLNELSDMVRPDFISSIHDVVEALKLKIDIHGNLKALEKPSIELMPVYIWKEKRKKEIREAMRRYLNEDKRIPLDWLNELVDLCVDLDN